MKAAAVAYSTNALILRFLLKDAVIDSHLAYKEIIRTFGWRLISWKRKKHAFRIYLQWSCGALKKKKKERTTVIQTRIDTLFQRYSDLLYQCIWTSPWVIFCYREKKEIWFGPRLVLTNYRSRTHNLSVHRRGEVSNIYSYFSSWIF